MATFLLRRIGFGLLTLWLLSFIVFGMANLLPGDVAARVLGPDAAPEAYEALRERLGLDRPLVVQYWDWLSGLLHGDLGTSLALQIPVSELLLPAIWNSLKLALVAFVLVVPLGIIGGIVAGLHRERALDRLITFGGISATIIPEFVTGVACIIVLSLHFHLFPLTAQAPDGSGFFTQIHYLILPSIPIVLTLFGYIARITRAGVIESYQADYTRTAYMKGLPERLVISRHVLRNGLLPTVAVVATQGAFLVGSLVVIEFLFNYPGIGQLLLTSGKAKDFPILQAAVMVVGVAFVVTSILADIAYWYLDPRVRHGNRE